jgi:hypothetical protein
MKIVAIITCFIFNGTPNQVLYCVDFGTSDGAFTSNGQFAANPSDNESQQENAVKAQVAAAVNAALGTSLAASDVRMM